MENKQYIELHGKSKVILHKDVSKMLVLFNDPKTGNLVLTILNGNVLYHTLKLYKYYNLLVELKGVSKVNNGKIHSENALIVRKVVSDVT